MLVLFFFFKQKTAYDMRISDWSSDVCSSDLFEPHARNIDFVGRLQRDVEADEVEQAAADRGKPVAADPLASRRRFAPHAGQHRHLRRALAHDAITRLGKAETEIGRAHV